MLQEGETELGWEYVGTGVTFDTVMLKDGSPPTNILTAKPESATFTVGDVLIDPNIPTTSVPIDKYLLITGIILVIFGGVLVLTKPKDQEEEKGQFYCMG